MLFCFKINILKNIQNIIVIFFQKMNRHRNLSIEMFKKVLKNNAAKHEKNIFIICLK